MSRATASTEAMDTAELIRRRINAAPMSRTQVIAVILTFLLSALDGYDVLSVSFAAPAITADWGVGKAALGIVLSAGLVGMALGSFFLAPFADRYGRKPLLLLALTLMLVGMLGSAAVNSIGQLTGWRVVTGLGIGTCVSIIMPISAEFANARWRPLCIAIMAIGFPVGGVTGGLLASALLPGFGWRGIFIAGAVAAAILLPLVAWLLPESLAWLASSPGDDRLQRVNATLARYGQPPVEVLHMSPRPRQRGYAAIFAPGQLGSTLWITAVNMLYTMTTYYVLSWLPQMVADAGFTASGASQIAAIVNLCGVPGGLLLGIAGHRFGLRGLVTLAISGFGVSVMLFGLAPASYWLLLLAGAVCGFFLFAGASGLYATVATTFAPEFRASGVGFAIGSGRVSSAIAPLLAGALFASGLDRMVVSFIFGAFAIVAGIVVFTGWRRFRLS